MENFKVNGLHNSFEELLSNPPAHAPAVYSTDKDGNILVTTFGELLELIEGIDTSKGTSVGIFTDNSLSSIVNIFAFAKAKKQIALLNPMDTKEQLAVQIKAADIDYLIGPEILVTAYKKCLTKGINNSKNGNILFFTSGTTAKSKAVCLTEQNLCFSGYCGSARLPLTPQDKLLSCLPLSHVFGFVCAMLWPFEAGASICLCRGLKYLMTDFNFYKPTAVSLVPQMAGFLLMHNCYNPELKLLLIGAGDCHDNVINGIKAQGIRVSFGYGLTETSSGIALSIGDNPRAMAICPGYEIKFSEDGEILVKASSTLMKGYYKNPEATKEVVKDGWLSTGDLGYLDEEGCIHITGRKKDILVTSGGTKIFCPEYEESLSKVLGLIDFAITLDDNSNLVLLIGSGVQVENCEDKISEFNKSYTRGHKIVKIKYIEEKLPRTQTGKIKRWQLKKLLD